MYHSFLIHSSADGYLGCFHVLPIINSAVMNIGYMCLFQFWFPQCVCPAVGLLGHKLSLIAILWNSAFRCLLSFLSSLLFTSLLFTAIFKASPRSHFAFLHFFSMGMVLIPVSCTMSQTSFHSSSERMKGWCQSKTNTELWM